MSTLSLSFRPYTLELKHQFTVSTYSRSTTPVVLTELSYEGFTGYGEASLPPYLGETQESVMKFLSRLKLSRFSDPFAIDEILNYVDSVEPENNAAKAAVDIALHDIIGKIKNQPVYKLWNLNTSTIPASSYTIGIDKPDVMIRKTCEMPKFGMIKLKLGTEYDKEIVKAVRSVSSLPFLVDVNQGWNNRDFALDMAFWLKEEGVILLEQPLPKENKDDLAWLSENSPIPVFADEGVKRLSDLENNLGIYNGVNIKLMKSTGLREAFKITELARKHNIKIMIGCMTETSCGVAAASHLSPLCNFADLDGSFLVKNNPFEDLEIAHGSIVIPTKPGIGVQLITENQFK